MGRITYVCATCEEHFTRKYSAVRHNLTIHNGIGDIVTLLEYLVGRSSRRYRPSHPSLYRGRRREEKRIQGFGHVARVTVADSKGDIFRPGDADASAIQSRPPSVSLPYPTATTEQQIPQTQPIDTTMTNEGTLSLSLSQQTAPKIRELKKLMHRYPIFPNPDMVIQCVTHFSINGDNTILDEKLEQLRWLDSAMGMPVPYATPRYVGTVTSSACNF